MMEAARTSETSANTYFTRRYIPEDKSELHSRRENLKSHTGTNVSPVRLDKTIHRKQWIPETS
jgi:hypothetical protein